MNNEMSSLWKVIDDEIQNGGITFDEEKNVLLERLLRNMKAPDKIPCKRRMLDLLAPPPKVVPDWESYVTYLNYISVGLGVAMFFYVVFKILDSATVSYILELLIQFLLVILTGLMAHRFRGRPGFLALVLACACLVIGGLLGVFAITPEAKIFTSLALITSVIGTVVGCYMTIWADELN